MIYKSRLTFVDCQGGTSQSDCRPFPLQGADRDFSIELLDILFKTLLRLFPDEFRGDYSRELAQECPLKGTLPP